MTDLFLADYFLLQNSHRTLVLSTPSRLIPIEVDMAFNSSRHLIFRIRYYMISVDLLKLPKESENVYANTSPALS